MTIRSIVAVVWGVVFITALNAPSFAATYSWTNTAPATFSDAGNWDPNAGAPPASGDTAVYSTGTYTVNFTANATNDHAQVRDGTTTTLNLNGNTYVLLNNDPSVSLFFNNAANLIIDGGTVQAPGGDANLYQNVTIQNGGLLKLTAANDRLYGQANPLVTVTGVGSAFTVANNLANIRLTVTDGASATVSKDLDLNGYGVKLSVGGGAGTSTLTVGSRLDGRADWPVNYGVPDINVLSGGVINATNGIAVRADPYGFKSTFTMSGGTVGIGAGTNLHVMSFNSSATVVPLLRGTGTINRLGASGSFTLQNDGVIRPGDTSATPAIGTLSLQNGDLVQNSSGTSFFDLGAGGIGDFINISSGAATIGGTNLISFGAYTPVYGDQWELLRAGTITYTAADNIAAALTPFGLQSKYSLFVYDNGSYQSLLLSIPEPSTAALFGLGGVLFLRRRR